MVTEKKGPWHLGSAVHNALNMCHKGHAFSGELAKVGIGVRLQQLVQQPSHRWKAKRLAGSRMPLS